MRKYTLLRTFALSRKDLDLLEKAASDQQIPKSQIIRELIRQNLATPAAKAA